MSSKIKEIERLALELEELGQRIPMVEKNALSILSFIRVLKFSVSDLVEVIE